MSKHSEIGSLVASIYRVKAAQFIDLAILFDFIAIAWDIWLNTQAWLYILTTQPIN